MMSDEILFEVPEEQSAHELSARFAPAQGAVEPGYDFWTVEVPLPTDPEAVALLLRNVEIWVAEKGLGAIRYRLDDRWYVLEAGEVAWTLEAA